MSEALQSWVYGFAFEGEHGKGAFVDAVERLTVNKTGKRFHAEGEFTERQRALALEVLCTVPGIFDILFKLKSNFYFI